MQLFSALSGSPVLSFCHLSSPCFLRKNASSWNIEYKSNIRDIGSNRQHKGNLTFTWLSAHIHLILKEYKNFHFLFPLCANVTAEEWMLTFT
jgi:hypothetical protein